MGLLSWFFPSEADRIQSARGYLSREKYNDARMELQGLESDEANTLRDEAETGLARLNIEAAVSWAEAGDDRRVAHHLELAEQFHKGTLAEEFREARRHMRTLRANRRAEEQRRKEEEEARLLAVDPLGLQGGPSYLDPEIPADMLGEDADELRARLAILVDGYPDDLREAVHTLGAPFARAVLDLDDGRADLALQGLLALPDDAPLVLWERARAAYALGDPRATARTLKAFAEYAGGHKAIGQQHTGTFLALALAEAGNPAEGLRVIRSVREDEPAVGGMLFAQLLLATRALGEAESVLTELIRVNPKHTPLYTLLAQVRLAGDHRPSAMRALEAAIEATHCPPGKCGYRPPDPNILRGLAVLYLEDGVEIPRALELEEQARQIVQKPGWEDLYARALAAVAATEPEAQSWVQRLWEATPEDHPGMAKLRTYLPGT